jgi:hypothetical protein
MPISDELSKRTRLFRRLRHHFKADLGAVRRGDTDALQLSRADRVLIDQCALLSFRAQEMRDAILAGQPVSDEDLVRTTNAAIRAMRSLKERAVAKVKPDPNQALRAFLQTLDKEKNDAGEDEE